MTNTQHAVKAGTNRTKVGGSRRAPNSRFPVSLNQAGHWDNYEESGMNRQVRNLSLALVCSDRVDHDALRLALTYVVERHGMLRTVFARTAGGVINDVLEDATPTLQTVTLDAPLHTSSGDLHERFATTAFEYVSEAMDLEASPPFRVRLFSFASHEMVLLLTMDHILGDAWSLRILQRDFNVAYAAFLGGGRPPMERLARDYSDHVAYERGLLAEDRLAPILKWWNEQLLMANERVLSFQEPAPWFSSTRSTSIGSYLHEVKAVRSDLDELAVASRTTTELLGLAAMIHARQTVGRFDCLNLVLQPASRGRYQDVIGPLYSILPVCFDLRGASTPHQVIAVVRDSVIDARSHELPQPFLQLKLHERYGYLKMGDSELNFGISPVRVPGIAGHWHRIRIPSPFGMTSMPRGSRYFAFFTSEEIGTRYSFLYSHEELVEADVVDLSSRIDWFLEHCRFNGLDAKNLSDN